MCSTALDAVDASNRRKRIFNNRLSGGISNTKRVTVITDHINQLRQFNTVDINSDPAHVEASILTASASTVRDSFIDSPRCSCQW